jgi:uncharacterized protein YllA (UPF0747 family)
MEIEELPGMPGIWLDFLRGQVPTLRPAKAVGDLAKRAEVLCGCQPANRDLIRILVDQQTEAPQISENIQRLNQPEAVVVLMRLSAGLFGGSAGQILKCLTGIKVCERLKEYSINAVPLAWIDPSPPQAFSRWSINLVDDDGQIHRLGISPSDTVTDLVFERLSQVSEIGCGVFDTEVLDILQTAFMPGRSFCSATARFFSALMKDWGMIVLDPTATALQPAVNEALARIRIPAVPFPGGGIPRHLAMNAALPVLACVVDPFELVSLATLPDFEEFGLPRLMAWPRVSSTIGDVRSRRTLDRYHLSLSQLFSGEAAVLRSLNDSLPRAGLKKLDGAISAVEATIVEVKLLVPEGSEISEAADSCREKVCYQLKRIRDGFESALDTKAQTAGRRIRNACNLLAPNQQLQENELAAVQIPLRYSRAGLRILWEQLDILNFEHQLIWMG